MDSKSTSGKAGEIYEQLNARFMQRAIEQGITAGIEAAQKSIDAEKQRARQGRQDKRLHNTRLLLKNYRLLRRHAEGAVYNARQAKERAIDILDGIEDVLDDHTYIESIKQSQQRTLVILEHIDEMLNFYRLYCEQNSPEAVRQYKAVMAAYIEEPKKSVTEICVTLSVNRRTYYRDLGMAIKPLTTLFFGIDSLHLRD